eukprot:TRINITY_DN50225_c0_g1_i1.p1 TRINITY_DN50225_c0_g1~~TRINITY_DN50225_c0_g1_i1.p1  ORF type:complete len:262 (-),score=49.31 TRINITY_DN50225_c0_g1_i1:244-1029(-)
MPSVRSMSRLVPIFCDVDGVLNSHWWGSELRHSASGGEVDGDMLKQLAALVSQAELEGFRPQLVISSTWRRERQLMELLHARFAAQQVELADSMRPLLDFLPKAADDADAWMTPCLGDGSSCEVRVREIMQWLQLRPHSFYLVLDDMNLLFSDSGKPTHLHDDKFIHTLDERTNVAGLSASHVQSALAKLRRQEDSLKREAGTGIFTEAEWQLLKESGLPLEILRRERCPLYIKDAAKTYLKNRQAEAKKASSPLSSCSLM